VRYSFTGDFKGLKRFEKRVRKAPESLRTVSLQLQEETIELIREGFEKQRDPYDKAWAPHSPLTRLRRTGRILEDTGGLKAAWFGKGVSDSGFEVANAKSYAIFHQAGTGLFGPKKKPIRPLQAKALRIPISGGFFYATEIAGSPRRRMVPDSGRLPRAWADRYVEVAQEVLTELFR
jgi:phage gpG-like protein